ncbi:uncharacterized protein LOC135087041 [Ostrinia nubilalis]|uniref:uncharacterized protein LOC135087041 n=1 Tax=Ostrinia nubilalis TaxID=29057 RepID=UPI0030822B69
MSLVVKLNRFKLLKCKGEKFARLEFRGDIKNSAVLVDNDEIIHVNQRFQWHIIRPVNPGEVITLKLLTRGRWGAPRVYGVYRLGLQILVADGQLCVSDTLVDEKNNAVGAWLEMDVFYTPPRPSVVLPVLPPEDEVCPTALSSARGSHQSDIPSVHGSNHGPSHASGHASGQASVHASGQAAHGPGHASGHASGQASGHASGQASGHGVGSSNAHASSSTAAYGSTSAVVHSTGQAPSHSSTAAHAVASGSGFTHHTTSAKLWSSFHTRAWIRDR